MGLERTRISVLYYTQRKAQEGADAARDAMSGVPFCQPNLPGEQLRHALMPPTGSGKRRNRAQTVCAARMEEENRGRMDKDQNRMRWVRFLTARANDF